jgi:hypothetical protein
VEHLSFLKDSKQKKVATIQDSLVELVEVLWLRLRELKFNYSGISVASALRVSSWFDFKLTLVQKSKLILCKLAQLKFW